MCVCAVFAACTVSVYVSIRPGATLLFLPFALLLKRENGKQSASERENQKQRARERASEREREREKESDRERGRGRERASERERVRERGTGREFRMNDKRLYETHLPF